jgi:ribosomal RNA methyltransferase Nop2
MEARSRKLDARAKRDAELNLGINQVDRMDVDGDKEDGNGEDGADGEELVTFELPTVEEREKEKASGGPELHEVQRRIQDCVRVLSDFKALSSKNRFVFRSIPFRLFIADPITVANPQVTIRVY